MVNSPAFLSCLNNLNNIATDMYIMEQIITPALLGLTTHDCSKVCELQSTVKADREHIL